MADGRRLTQVLLNLLGNAIKYNRPGGRVDVRALRRSDGMVGLQVADTGLGMSARQLERVFEPFDRVGREGTDIEGSGLGMALARSMTTAMAGRIEVTSVEGQGSTFTLLLPAAATAPDDSPDA
jgi:signal transduction histidine kinase